MWRAHFYEHPNYNPEKTAELWHMAILPRMMARYNGAYIFGLWRPAGMDRFFNALERFQESPADLARLTERPSMEEAAKRLKAV